MIYIVYLKMHPFLVLFFGEKYKDMYEPSTFYDFIYHGKLLFQLSNIETYSIVAISLLDYVKKTGVVNHKSLLTLARYHAPTYSKLRNYCGNQTDNGGRFDHSRYKAYPVFYGKDLLDILIRCCLEMTSTTQPIIPTVITDDSDIVGDIYLNGVGATSNYIFYIYNTLQSTCAAIGRYYIHDMYVKYVSNFCKLSDMIIATEDDPRNRKSDRWLWFTKDGNDRLTSAIGGIYMYPQMKFMDTGVNPQIVYNPPMLYGYMRDDINYYLQRLCNKYLKIQRLYGDAEISQDILNHSIIKLAILVLSQTRMFDNNVTAVSDGKREV